MIFVTVGMTSWDFSRLIKEMDRIAGKTDEEVVMQISHAKYTPKNARYFRFTSDEEIKHLYERARVIVSHASAGPVIAAKHHNKPVVVVPRRQIYGEHIDDHQIRIAREFEREGKVIVVYDINNLEKTIEDIKSKNIVNQRVNSDNKLAIMLKEYIDSFEGR